ncbi:hypothetical protein [Geminocystis sp. NIES-3709]|uniref:hypothetical protein n=1 Tax=Geminocystis sp. NIES-3709 TaxID=1617448 RepID=UPI0005FC986D|nr:hypothetical protein [Geminocystis sp. NIES-3709]BAQ65130.1 hypothetical protein GM3709_1895 [Geminocystis sp. NIES-3709]
MAKKNNPQSTSPIYYVSPSGKVHAETCRHCQPEKEGWQKLDSFLNGINKGYQPCRLCCPSESEIKVEENTNQQSETIIAVTKESVIATSQDSEKVEETTITAQVKEITSPDTEAITKTPDKEVKENTASETKVKQTKSKEKKDSTPKKQEKEKEKIEKKRYKILAGNGCHQAIAEIQGILVPPQGENEPFLIILPDGFQLEATFKTPRIKWMAMNTDVVIGAHWFRVYPKMKDDKLISVQIVAWDKNMPSNPRGEEHWEFTGVWTAQKNITVQRSMMTDDIRKTAKETGFIKKFKYTFINSFDWVKNKKLWMGYVYKIICKRKGDVLEIKKVIPFACPRIKPDPKNFKRSDDRDNNDNKGEKKDFKPKDFKSKDFKPKDFKPKDFKPKGKSS